MKSMNTMNVEIVSSEMIKPSKPTPPHLRTLNLSLIDQLTPLYYVPLALFYINNNNLNTPQFISHLKKSLSQTLTRFYPLAGRPRDFMHVNCNDHGVSYKEARANFHLSQFLEKPHLQMLIKFVSHDVSSIHLETKAMVSLQVTIFDCGGIVIGMSVSHRIMDAVTITMFLNSWAETTRGYEKVSQPDWSTSSLLFPAVDSLPTDFLAFFNKKWTSQTNFVVRRYVFDASAIANLKPKAKCDAVPNPTRIEALTSFSWGRLMVASKALIGTTTDTSMITHLVNLSPRLVPPLPKRTLQNLIWVVLTMYEPTESEPHMHELVELVNEMFVNLSGEVLKNFVGENGKKMIIDNSKDLIDLVENGKSIDIVTCTSWCNMGFYEPDFGWGKPVWVGAALEGDGQRDKREVFFIETRSGGVEMFASHPTNLASHPTNFHTPLTSVNSPH